MTNERSVVIVGSGAAGMAAALAAASAGASVTVLEAAEHIGGTTAISGGGIWLAGEGEAERVAALTYLRALGLGDADDALCETYVDAGGDAIAALSARAGLTWQRIGGFSDYHADLPGGSEAGRSLEIAPVRVPAAVLARVRPDPHGVPPVTIVEEASPDPPGAAEIAARARDGVCTRGRGLVAACAAALEAAGVDVRTAVRATRLATRDGAVVGVEARGERFGGRVVLASGGFERDPSLVRAFLGGPMLAPAGPPSNRGDGLRMGMAAGAALGNMSEAWWAPAMAVSGATIDGAQLFRMLFMDCAKPGGILIDGRGRRFADEGANYNDLGRALFAFDAGSYAYPAVPCWLVFDAARRRTAVGPLAPGEPDPDWLVRAASLGELAERVGLPAAAVERSVARFNELAARRRRRGLRPRRLSLGPRERRLGRARRGRRAAVLRAEGAPRVPRHEGRPADRRPRPRPPRRARRGHPGASRRGQRRREPVRLRVPGARGDGRARARVRLARRRGRRRGRLSRRRRRGAGSAASGRLTATARGAAEHRGGRTGPQRRRARGGGPRAALASVPRSRRRAAPGPARRPR